MYEVVLLEDFLIAQLLETASLLSQIIVQNPLWSKHFLEVSGHFDWDLDHLSQYVSTCNTTVNTVNQFAMDSAWPELPRNTFECFAAQARNTTYAIP